MNEASEVLMFTVERLAISDEERGELVRRSRAHTSPVRDARRAEVILLCAEGLPLRRIASRVGMDQHQVGVWRRRFRDRRQSPGPHDRPPPGAVSSPSPGGMVAEPAAARSEASVTDDGPPPQALRVIAKANAPVTARVVTAIGRCDSTVGSVHQYSPRQDRGPAGPDNALAAGPQENAS